jgi:hypothetical protein
MFSFDDGLYVLQSIDLQDFTVILCFVVPMERMRIS